MRDRIETISLMIVGVIFGAICVTFVMAVFAELALPHGLVRYAALGLFVGAAAICAHQLYMYLRTALYEWGTYRDIVPVDKDQYILVRRDDKISHYFEELGAHLNKAVWVPADPIDPESLANAGLDSVLTSRLLNGGNSNEYGDRS